MKATTYIRTLALAGLALAATACDENSWNNHLDGFEDFVDEPFTQVETVEYTLTDADYSTIAGLAANIALAGTDGADALKAVGDLKRFSEAAPASKYVPAFLATTNFPYFVLSDGSAVKLTYNEATEEPESYAHAANAQTFTVHDIQYKDYVWGGSDNYILGFAPSQNPADYIPMLLANSVNCGPGTFMIVSYNQATQEPVFGGEIPATPQVLLNATFADKDDFGFTFEDVVLTEPLTYVWKLDDYGYMKASAFKDNTNLESDSWLVSPVIDLTGYEDPFFSFDEATNFFADIATAAQEATVWAREEGGQWQQLTDYTFPSALGWTFVNSGDIDLAEYAGKKMQLGFRYKSTATKAGTWEVKNIVVTATPASRSAASRAMVTVPMVVKNVLYTFTETGWAPAPSDFSVLSPADYTAMGQTYPNLPAAEPYLSKWLDSNSGFAASGDVRFVVWTKYADGTSSTQCSAYSFDGTQWKPFNFAVEKTVQFVRTGGKWMYDPNVTITLPAGKNQAMSTQYFQACVDWVYENKCVPLGSTGIKSGMYWVTKYGNNEYYSGTSAYQGNVDIRPSEVRTQYAAGVEGMTDEEIVAFLKNNFMNEVMPGALAALHPEAEPAAGFDVLYTVNFYTYDADRKTLPQTAVFKVTAKGQFAPVSCTWGYPAE